MKPYSRIRKRLPGWTNAAALPPVDKQTLVDAIIALLDAELQRYANAARDARAEATDEQSKAENKYDTRGLEASYLAHGQSRQVMETKHAREQIASLKPCEFSQETPIGLGSLILLESKGEECWYFLASAAGGTEVTVEGNQVLVVTPRSPIGRSLMGTHVDDQIEAAGALYRVVSVI